MTNDQDKRNVKMMMTWYLLRIRVIMVTPGSGLSGVTGESQGARVAAHVRR